MPRSKSRPGLYQRNGWWNVAIYTKTKGGSRAYRKALGTQDATLAAEWYDTNAPRIRADLWRQAEGLHVDHYWEEALSLYLKKRADLGPDKFRLAWINERLAGMKLDAITYDFWHRVTEQLQAEVTAKRGHCSGANLNRYTALVGAVFNTVAIPPYKWVAYERERFYMYPESEARDVVASVAQAQARFLRLPDWAKDPYLYALATGARRKNVIGLQWAWVNLSDRVVNIPPSDFKQRKAHRQVLNGTALEIIRRQPGALQDAATREPCVFLKDGKPITKDELRHAWDRTKTPEDAHIRWHDLRRTWATWMREQGVSLDDTQALGGWSSKEMLVKVYSKPSATFLAGKAGVMDSVLAEITLPTATHGKGGAG